MRGERDAGGAPIPASLYEPSWLQDYEALRNSVGSRRGTRDLIVVDGPDAETFLQGQLSQDVAALEPGSSAASLLLRPEGRLISVLRVYRIAPQRFWLEAQAGDGRRSLERLLRFKLRTNCEMTLRQIGAFSVLGPHAPPQPSWNASEDFERVSAAVRWGAVGGWDSLGGPPGCFSALRLCEEAAFEALRIASGVPAGAELAEGMIPEEAGIVAETVCFTKGCFVGQELVARIDSRGGNVPKRLRGVVLSEEGIPRAGMPQPGSSILDSAGAAAGSLTSVGFSPTLNRVVALAYVKRKVSPPAAAGVPVAGASLPAEIRTLPLLA